MPVSPTVHVYLVPGFLGFARLAKLDYFIGVADQLEAELAREGVEAKVHALDTDPAASLRKRARSLADQLLASAPDKHATLHLVGHSTGGLDIRVLLSRGSNIGGEYGPEGGGGPKRKALNSLLARVATATGVAAPFFGTPIADLMVRLSVDRMLGTMSSAIGTAPGRELSSLVLRAGGLITHLVDRTVGLPDFLDWIDDDVLSQDPGPVIDYLAKIDTQVGALRHLTQEGADLANALLVDRSDVAYGSIITGTDEPSGRIHLAEQLAPPKGVLTKFQDMPLIYASTLVFRLAWQIVANLDETYPYSGRLEELRHLHATDRADGHPVGAVELYHRTSDGIVPSASQAHGRVLGVFASDHLDCVGHYPRVDPRDGSWISGWVRSGAKFDDERFAELWRRVAQFIASRITAD